MSIDWFMCGIMALAVALLVTELCIGFKTTVHTSGFKQWLYNRKRRAYRIKNGKRE